jgi:TatD DNase family protein
MKLIDTHAHLCASEFSVDLIAVLRRAQSAGVVRVIAVAESLSDARRNLKLAAAFPGMVAPAAGLFPTRLDQEEADSVLEFTHSHREAWIAIGEVGLDYWKVQDEQEREVQRQILGRFIAAALELDLPLNVHSRSAGHHTIDFLLRRGAERVQMHAFDGKASRALAGVEAGFFFSVPPSVVRSAQKQKLVRQLPLSCLLLETDSPVLGAKPGERNEPANTAIALKAVADLKGETEGKVAEAVYENTLRLYGADKIRPTGGAG